MRPAPRAEGTLDETLTLESTSLLMTNVQDPFVPENPPYALSDEERLIAVDVVLGNVGTEKDLTYSHIYFTAIDLQGEHIYVPSQAFGTTVGAGSLAPGSKATGRVVFLVPATVEINTIRYKPFEETALILIDLP